LGKGFAAGGLIIVGLCVSTGSASAAGFAAGAGAGAEEGGGEAS
jgi:hypothetical protein